MCPDRRELVGVIIDSERKEGEKGQGLGNETPSPSRSTTKAGEWLDEGCWTVCANACNKSPSPSSTVTATTCLIDSSPLHALKKKRLSSRESSLSSHLFLVDPLHFQFPLIIYIAALLPGGVRIAPINAFISHMHPAKLQYGECGW